MLDMMKYFPKLTDYRNEIVFYLGLIASFLLGLIEIINGIDLNSLDSYIAAIPLLLALIQRQFAYGLETVKREFSRNENGH